MITRRHIRNPVMPIMLFVIILFTTPCFSIHSWRKEGFFTASFISAEKGTFAINNFLLANNSVITLAGKNKKYEFQCELRTDLSYSKFLDSIWFKNNDQMLLNLLLTETDKSKRTRWSANLTVRSQLTDTWTYRLNRNILTKTWRSGPMTPGTVNLSYGMNVKLSGSSSINAGLATIRLNSFNIDKNVTDSTDLRAGKVGVRSTYGCNLLFSINEKLFSFMSIENRSLLFIHSLSEKGITLDLHNRIWFRLYKNIRLKIDTGLQFDPATGKKVRMRHEWLIGWYLK